MDKQTKQTRKSGLKILTQGEIREAFEFQKDNSDWTFYKERELTETTLHSRFNFLLLVFSLFANAYFMVQNNNDKLTILIVGLVIIILLSIGIYRAYTRFMILTDVLHCLDEKDVFPVIIKEYSARPIQRIFKRNAIVGYMVPSVMIISFIVGIGFNLWSRCGI